MAQPKQSYTTPVVCSYGNDISKEWYIYFRFFHNGEWRNVKRREGLNRINNKAERKAEAEALCEARHVWLINGWNPILDPKNLSRLSETHQTLKLLKTMPLGDALLFAIEKHPLSAKSHYDYLTTVRNVINAATHLKLQRIPVHEITRQHVKALMDFATKFQGTYEILVEGKLKSYHRKAAWSSKAYNKNLTFLSALFSELVEWEVIEHNPAFRISRRDEEVTEKFIPPTIEEKSLISEFLRVKHPAFRLFIQTLYQTGIRPKEILGLQIKDLEIANNVFRLRPFSEKTKTKKERTAVLNDTLMKEFLELELSKYPSEYFIFSTGFRPGEVRVDRRVATKLWDTLVRQQLGINKYMYSVKHMGADDLADQAMKAGIPEERVEDMVKDQLGHSSRFMTQRYLRKGLQISQGVIRRISPNF